MRHSTFFSEAFWDGEGKYFRMVRKMELAAGVGGKGLRTQVLCQNPSHEQGSVLALFRTKSKKHTGFNKPMALEVEVDLA